MCQWVSIISSAAEKGMCKCIHIKYNRYNTFIIKNHFFQNMIFRASPSNKEIGCKNRDILKWCLLIMDAYLPTSSINPIESCITVQCGSSESEAASLSWIFDIQLNLVGLLVRVFTIVILSVTYFIK